MPVGSIATDEPKPDTRLSRSTTAVRVATVLRDRILGGYYQEGQFLRQEQVAKELGVSRIPVREAITQLVAEGLLLWEKYRGAVVPKLSLSEIEEIYEMREMIEPYLLKSVVKNITAEEIEYLRDVIRRSNSASDLSEWAGLNVEFHTTLYKAADKPLAMQVLDNLITRSDRYLKMQRSLSSETRRESDEQHRLILDLVEKGQTRQAVEALRKHISWNADDIAKTVGVKNAESDGSSAT